MSGDLEAFVEAAGVLERDEQMTGQQAVDLCAGAPEIVNLARTLRQTIYKIEEMLHDGYIDSALELIRKHNEGDTAI